MSTSTENLRRVFELDTELNAVQDFDILLERILMEARKIANADAGSIYIREGTVLTVRFAQNDTKQAQMGAGRKLIYNIISVNIDNRTMSGYAAANRETKPAFSSRPHPRASAPRPRPPSSKTAALS